MSENEIDEIAEKARQNQTIAQPIQKNEDHVQYTSVSLPSDGLLGYPKVIEYRDIMIKDEKAIANATEATFFVTLNTVLKSLIKDTSWYDDMSIFDRDFLLMWVWADNYDTNKNVTHTCSSCGEDSKYIIDVTELEISNLKDNYNPKYVHKFRSGKEYGLRLLTVRDEVVANKFVKNKNNSVDEVYVMMCLSVVTDKVMNVADKIEWVEKTFTGKDIAEIRGFHEYYKFGIADSVERNCTVCGEGETISIPFQVDHFIPTIEYDFGSTV